MRAVAGLVLLRNQTHLAQIGLQEMPGRLQDMPVEGIGFANQRAPSWVVDTGHMDRAFVLSGSPAICHHEKSAGGILLQRPKPPCVGPWTTTTEAIRANSFRINVAF